MPRRLPSAAVRADAGKILSAQANAEYSAQLTADAVAGAVAEVVKRDTTPIVDRIRESRLNAPASPGAVFTASDAYRANARDTKGMVRVASPAQVAHLLSTNDDRGVFNPTTRPEVGEAPTPGGRVTSRCTVIPLEGGETIARARETSRSGHAAVTAWGTAAPEFSIAFDRDVPNLDRVPVYVNVDEDVWDSTGEAQRIVDSVLGGDLRLAADSYVLNKSTTGALTDASVASFAKSTATRFDALIDAATRVRGAGFEGPLTAVVAPSDYKLTLTEAASGIRAYDSAILKDLDLTIVNTSAVASGTALVGDFGSAIDVWVDAASFGTVTSAAQVANLKVSNSHASNWLDGRVTVLGTVQIQSRVQRVSGLVKVTGY